MRKHSGFLLKLTLVLAIGIPVGHMIGRRIIAAQNTAQDQATSSTDRSARPRLDSQLRKEYQDAARAFAERVAKKDNARFSELFERAYQLAEQSALDSRGAAGRMAAGAPTTLPQGLSLEQSIRRREASLASADSIFNDAVFNDNFRKLIDEGGVPRIVGGVETDPGEFQDCVAVGSGDRWCCTGTLIAPNVVVTAGHCFAGCASRVYLGLNTDTPDPDRIIKVKAIRHKDFKTPSADLIENDLTLLILERDATDVTPRKIAASDALDRAAWCRLVGFGTIDVFGSFGYGRQRKVDVAIASPSCAGGTSARYGCFSGHEIVAGGGGKDSCGGDSGGPLYIKVDGAWYLAGATSRATKEWRLSGRPCGEGGNYVRLDKFADWIRTTAQENGGHWQQ